MGKTLEVNTTYIHSKVAAFICPAGRISISNFFWTLHEHFDQTLCYKVFDDDKLIPVFGFGDKLTQDKAIFPFFPDRLCYTFQEVLTRYAEITPKVNMAGPTSFAPLIR